MFVIAKKKSRNHRLDLVVKFFEKSSILILLLCDFYLRVLFSTHVAERNLSFLTIPEECMVAVSILITDGYHLLIIVWLSKAFRLFSFSIIFHVVLIFLFTFILPPLAMYYSRGGVAGVLMPHWSILNWGLPNVYEYLPSQTRSVWMASPY
jgi:hypothetical protein